MAKTMKLSKTMQETLDLLINAPYARRDRKMIYLKSGSSDGNYGAGGFIENGVITIWGHTNTLKALERRGLVEILKLGGSGSDEVKLLQHENTNRPLEEMYDLHPIKVYRISAIEYFKYGKFNEQLADWDRGGGGSWVQDKKVEYVTNYWDLDEEGRGNGWFVTRIEDAITGETLYTWDKEEARRRFQLLWG